MLTDPKNKCCRQITASKTFTSDTTGETFSIEHNLNCRSPYVLYLGYCIKCPNQQYVGKSEPPAHKRFNTHRYDAKKPSGLSFDKHFATDGHNFDHDARFILLEQIKNYRSLPKNEIRAIMEHREDYWMLKLKTLSPTGLNDKLNSATTARIHSICN